MNEWQRERLSKKRKERLLLFLCVVSVMILVLVGAILVLQIQSRASESVSSEYLEGREREGDSTTSLPEAMAGEWVISYEDESSSLLDGTGSGGYPEVVIDRSDRHGEGSNYVGEHGDWRLILVNEDNPVPEGFRPNLITLDNGQRIDERILEPLNEMFAAARNQGISLQVNSGYRSIAEQQIIFDGTLNHWLSHGFSYEEALERTRRYVALPGTSEHHLGLAVDISEVSSWTWLHENSAQFGFILRYPMGSEHITGFAYEPWHFRYVGVENAMEIHRRGITLEEFLR